MIISRTRWIAFGYIISIYSFMIFAILSIGSSKHILYLFMVLNVTIYTYTLYKFPFTIFTFTEEGIHISYEIPFFFKRITNRDFLIEFKDITHIDMQKGSDDRFFLYYRKEGEKEKGLIYSRFCTCFFEGILFLYEKRELMNNVGDVVRYAQIVQRTLEKSHGKKFKRLNFGYCFLYVFNLLCWASFFVFIYFGMKNFIHRF